MRDIKGTHMLVDGYVEDASTLEPERLVGLFDSLVEVLDMRYLQRPQALQVPVEAEKLDSEEDEGGWSVTAQITTSHISLHGWPMRCAFMMDVFSCKDFNTELAKQVIYEKLGVWQAVVQVIERRGPFPPVD
jgi:S-adenosylmethionine decarboxylase